MPLFEYPELAFSQITLLVISWIWLLQRNDEIPLIISSFMFYVASYRYWAVTQGINHWVNLTSLGLSSVTQEAALEALAYIVFGQICLLGSYMWHQRKIMPIIMSTDVDYSVLKWLYPKVIVLGLFCLPLVVVTRSQVIMQLRVGKSLAFQISSYLYLFPLALVGITTLIFCLWKFGCFPSLLSKIYAISIVFGVFELTFGSTGRFQFMGWITAAGIIVSSSYRPKTRLVIIGSFLLFAISLFAIAGAMRNPNFADDRLNQAAWERASSAEDANMLDGFVLLQNVYPQRLDFQWGMEHLEILMRPIPRAWWPEKPVGGYMNKLGLTIHGGKGTLGISPSLFGSFYAEGGIIGIFLFSLLYGIIMAKIVGYTTKLKPFAAILVRAILCASLLPLLRGGDLPGIYAWIGMAFWPCFLLLWIKRADWRLKLPESVSVYYREIE
ncbi:O-antigen polymerase [Coleofasciculus sp. G2-EDA-02]|uniref:O-antigen polymerase n=1 Tax=Coleofasciculus sp. G2-EDA-02 TaxID=3069529 RepID=UPI0032F65279